MGFLIKFILIVILIIWLLGKVAKFFLKAFLNSQMQNMANQQKAQHQPKYPEGSIHVDSIPNNVNHKKNKDSLGGEYVDYEVIK